MVSLDIIRKPGHLLAVKIEALARLDLGEVKLEDYPEVIILGGVIRRIDTSTWPVKPYVPRRPPVGNGSIGFRALS